MRREAGSFRIPPGEDVNFLAGVFARRSPERQAESSVRPGNPAPYPPRSNQQLHLERVFHSVFSIRRRERIVQYFRRLRDKLFTEVPSFSWPRQYIGSLQVSLATTGSSNLPALSPISSSPRVPSCICLARAKGDVLSATRMNTQKIYVRRVSCNRVACESKKLLARRGAARRADSYSFSPVLPKLRSSAILCTVAQLSSRESACTSEINYKTFIIISCNLYYRCKGGSYSKYMRLYTSTIALYARISFRDFCESSVVRATQTSISSCRLCACPAL